MFRSIAITTALVTVAIYFGVLTARPVVQAASVDNTGAALELILNGGN